MLLEERKLGKSKNPQCQPCWKKVRGIFNRHRSILHKLFFSGPVNEKLLLLSKDFLYNNIKELH